jgi:hypothetical protein
VQADAHLGRRNLAVGDEARADALRAEDLADEAALDVSLGSSTLMPEGRIADAHAVTALPFAADA